MNRSPLSTSIGGGGGFIRAVHPVLGARDVSTSIRFFLEIGFELVFQDSPDNPRYAALTRDGVELHVQWAGADQFAYPVDRPALRFLVDDPDVLYHEFVAAVHATPAGESPWAAPGDTPWGTREFHLRDPSGNVLQFYRPLASGHDPHPKAS